MKMTSLQKMIIVAALMAVVAVMVIAFVIVPQFAQISDLQRQKTDAESRRVQAVAVLESLRVAKGRAAVTEAELLKIGTQMPESPQLPSLIIELQDIANAAGIDVSSITPAEPVPVVGGQYTEIALTTQLTAEWDDLLDYLKRLDHSTRLLRVTALSVAPPEESDATTDTPKVTALTVTMTTKAYVIGNNGVVSSAATQTAGTP
jgi:Tfp pilus assembly protein PilO